MNEDREQKLVEKMSNLRVGQQDLIYSSDIEV